MSEKNRARSDYLESGGFVDVEHSRLLDSILSVKETLSMQINGISKTIGIHTERLDERDKACILCNETIKSNNKTITRLDRSLTGDVAADKTGFITKTRQRLWVIEKSMKDDEDNKNDNKTWKVWLIQFVITSIFALIIVYATYKINRITTANNSNKVAAAKEQ